MNIQEALKKAVAEIQETSNTTKLDSQILLCFVLEVSDSFVITHSNQELTKEQELEFFKLIEKRKEHYPVAYLTEEKEFYGRSFFVNKHTLIPRPETEELVEYVLSNVIPSLSSVIPAKAGVPSISASPSSTGSRIKSGMTVQNAGMTADSKIKILDLGTGSGCIAITLKKELPNAEVFAGDISKEALEVAKKNAKNLDAEIQFFETDFMSAFQKQSFDVIIANLPYVQETERDPSIQHEPDTALFSGLDGLNHYRELAKQLNVNSCRHLLLEIDDRQKNEIKNIFTQAKNTTIINDLSGLARIVDIRF